ncbi:hypothetical protein PPL_12343 [Heterostelium album PN500]|uniref:Uncharacterized protein n=1 Tax=Heterostelium pallidum (strain ATCC 26659 / Pp 5 / PN500) TaxID=670386 RepID=D3BMD0_HETP5|nr:hypothetical protein PPL_12343 [Heterostelium album PN500]EFA77731.1 hypothetical protein PPL_12343 [Heterostelium album PN500]|eukprot:XP_020429859.1 hypothetical protein PPL_12343 [Heterostelium album PN500]
MLLHDETIGFFCFFGMVILLYFIGSSLCSSGSYQPPDIMESNSLAQTKDAELIDFCKSTFNYFPQKIKEDFGTSQKMAVYVYMRSYDLFEEFQKLLAKQMGDVDVRNGLPSAPIRSFTQSMEHASMSKEGIILYTVDASTMGSNVVDAASDDQDDFTRLVLEYPNYHVIHTLLTSPGTQASEYINSPMLDWITENNITSLVFECTSYTTDLSSQESFVRLQSLIGGDLNKRG